MTVLVVLRICGKLDVCFSNRRDGGIAAVWMGQMRGRIGVPVRRFGSGCGLRVYFSERAFARGSGSLIESQYRRIFRVGFYERLNAIERFIFVAEHGVGAALGTLHLRFKLFQIVIGKIDILFCGCSGSCHCAESQCQKEENGFLKHITFMLKWKGTQ